MVVREMSGSKRLGPPKTSTTSTTPRSAKVDSVRLTVSNEMFGNFFFDRPEHQIRRRVLFRLDQQTEIWQPAEGVIFKLAAAAGIDKQLHAAGPSLRFACCS
jgi:hypothetical protein